jgi:hypothetical protein
MATESKNYMPFLGLSHAVMKRSVLKPCIFPAGRSFWLAKNGVEATMLHTEQDMIVVYSRDSCSWIAAI